MTILIVEDDDRKYASIHDFIIELGRPLASIVCSAPRF